MRERLDLLLVERDLASSREKARGLIMSGVVLVDGAPVDKPGTLVKKESVLKIKSRGIPYVGRGGLKLASALSAFGIIVSGKVALDAGASTGGFTDCLLQNGAARVYAVDVGRGQLDLRLRQDERVVCLEGKNVRHLTFQDVPEAVDIVTVDLSFISLGKVLPNLARFLKPDGDLVALIKPQFEAGRRLVRRGGVVKNPEVHLQVLKTVIGQAQGCGFRVSGLIPCPLKGPAGNIEFLGHFRKEQNGEVDPGELARRAVNLAHGRFSYF